MGMGAFLGGMMTLTPECRQPRMAPPRASTMKLTRNLQGRTVRTVRTVRPVRRSALAGSRGWSRLSCKQNVEGLKVKHYDRDSLPSMFDRKVFTKA